MKKKSKKQSQKKKLTLLQLQKNFIPILGLSIVFAVLLIALVIQHNNFSRENVLGLSVGPNWLVHFFGALH